MGRLGAIVAERRRELGMTQARLAERGGVSRQWLVRFEGGTHSVETGLALRMLRALDLHLELTATSNSLRGEITTPVAVLDPNCDNGSGR